MYKIKITSLANSDLNDIVLYITDTLKNPTAATALLDDVEKCFSNIEENPLMYSICQNTRLQSLGYRRAVIKKHIMIYKIDEKIKTVFVLRFFYGKQNYETLL